MKKAMVVLLALVATGCASPEQRQERYQMKHERVCMKYYTKMMLRVDTSNEIAVKHISDTLEGMGCKVRK